MYRTLLPAAVLAVLIGLLNRQVEAQEFRSQFGRLLVQPVVKGLNHPWGLAFLPDGRMLVTERPGRMRIVNTQGGVSLPLPGVPKVFTRGQGGGQGGLLDVAIDPDFESNRNVYFCFAEPGNEYAGTAVGKARLTETLGQARLEGTKVIFRQYPKTSNGAHFGCRLAFDRTGAIFVTLGDHHRSRHLVQTWRTHIGKVVRIMPDGSIPDDNPRPKSVRPEIWSLGHRNVQGAAIHPTTGALWTIEHGPRGGDELNSPKAGKNYGWPVISYGTNYDGSQVGVGTHKEGMMQPLAYWDPSIAPSGMTFYTGDVFPNWRGNVLVAALKAQFLVRIVLKDGRVAGREYLLKGIGKRLRHVVQGPDGLLYLLTDEDNGEILRLRPAN